MQSQTHSPALFALAWQIVTQAMGKNTPYETCNETVWLEGLPDATVLHASNVETYVRVTLPTETPGTDVNWRYIVQDFKKAVTSVAGHCKAKDVTATGMFGGQLIIVPLTVGGDPGPRSVRFQLEDSFQEAPVGSEATVPILDHDWPAAAIGMLDDFTETAPTKVGVTASAAGFLTAIAKALGPFDYEYGLITGGYPARLFDVHHPKAPTVRVQGLATARPVAA